MDHIVDAKYGMEDARYKLLGKQWFSGRTGVKLDNNSPVKLPKDEEEK
jgi:hypothetical protein